MPVPQSTLTYEQLMESFREMRDQMKESRAEFAEWKKESAEWRKETERIVKETTLAVASLGSRIGEIVENMVAGNIIEQFRELGYEVTARCPNKTFGIRGTRASGEIDLLLEDGDVAILIEAKTTLKIDHIHEHIERLEKYRHYIDSRGSGEKRRYVGAVAGTVVADNVIDFAHANGLYVIVQSARTTKIMPTPEGFVAREW